MPHKERFAACYIDKFPHFGSASTSRVEGNHHVIKSYLRVDTLHLLTLTKRLGLMLANQHVELNAAIEKQRCIRHISSAIATSRTWSTRFLILLWTSFCNNLSMLKWGDMRSSHALRGSRNRGGCLVITTFAVVWKPRFWFSCRTFMSSDCWTETPLSFQVSM